ncbi:MAG: DUF2804 domain-containing protein, partial [Anaerolineales bacterium]|nr:DUF2804 domain-containing protein [Anaerolineales bacterium]
NHSGPLLDSSGRLNHVGWSRQQMLDCNLERAAFYPHLLYPFQRFRLKRWDYYAIFTPQRFFSATIADLGYAGNIFVYILDFATHELHEEGLVIPLGKGVALPRNSNEGDSLFDDGRARLFFQAGSNHRHISVSWPGFHDGKGIHAEIRLSCPPRHESMTIVIPIEHKRFYYNRKINCLPAEGYLQYGELREALDPNECLGSLDWGRGVWAYRSFWNWASASGFLTDGRTIGLNLGSGFGDTCAATEDCLILDGCVHKLGGVKFAYSQQDYKKTWKFEDAEGRLALDFQPFTERVARTNLGVIFSEVHQMFGRYSGRVVTDEGETIQIDDLIGFAEEHHARW